MKIYISGKITGDRRYKAKFREVEKKLAAAGHIVLNPATAPEGLRPVDYMRLCFAMMEAADVVLFMQDYQDKLVDQRISSSTATSSSTTPSSSNESRNH